MALRYLLIENYANCIKIGTRQLLAKKQKKEAPKFPKAKGCSSQNPKIQKMVSRDGRNKGMDTVYGFTHDGKIYLNPAVISSEAAVHEYTHLWDSYTQRTNPELWHKGMQIFRGTSLWNDVLADENYADIRDDDDLVLSECHARICGKIADAVLQKIIERDGGLKQAEMIDWDKETVQYLMKEFPHIISRASTPEAGGIDTEAFKDYYEDFMAAPMKDLFQRGLDLKLQEQVAKERQDAENHVTKADMSRIREQCREIIKKPADRITGTDRQILANTRLPPSKLPQRERS